MNQLETIKSICKLYNIDCIEIDGVFYAEFFGNKLEIKHYCIVNEQLENLFALQKFLSITLKEKKFYIRYHDHRSYYLTYGNESYIIYKKLTPEIYLFIYQVLKKECPIEVFYDWFVEKYL